MRGDKRRWMLGERGLTLVEMMVTMLIVAIMGLALVGFLRSQHQSVTRQNDGVLTTQNARAAIDMLARELRNARYDPRAGGLAALTAMEDDSVAWTADLDEDGAVVSSDPIDDTYENVAYWHDAGTSTLVRWAMPTLGGTAMPVSDGVDSLRLTYFDGTGAVTADSSLVELIRIRLWYSTPDGVQTGALETQVALRNNIYAR
jgi:prepilin-type N-terminal cleavage/methylation domain-containing protein